MSDHASKVTADTSWGSKSAKAFPYGLFTTAWGSDPDLDEEQDVPNAFFGCSQGGICLPTVMAIGFLLRWAFSGRRF